MIIGRSQNFRRERRNAKSSTRKSSIARVVWPVTAHLRMPDGLCAPCRRGDEEPYPSA
jgi:hypothetical protein